MASEVTAVNQFVTSIGHFLEVAVRFVDHLFQAGGEHIDRKSHPPFVVTVGQTAQLGRAGSRFTQGSKLLEHRWNRPGFRLEGLLTLDRGRGEAGQSVAFLPVNTRLDLQRGKIDFFFGVNSREVTFDATVEATQFVVVLAGLLLELVEGCGLTACRDCLVDVFESTR